MNQNVRYSKLTYFNKLFFHSIYFTLSILAFIATTTVLALIKTAPAAGLSSIPALYKTPAANGSATMLYPVAQARFCIIFL